jgi:predicted 2-oxoglutarate/Fe(II)-dependent dioxygenase YbiX
MIKNNIENESLKNFIHVEKGLIPSTTCEFVINTIKDKKWIKHSWGDGKTFYSHSTKELDVLPIPIDGDLENILNPFISQSVILYNQFLGEGNVSKIRYFSPIRFNRYKKDQIMRKHSDHIHSIFDGELKGIPVLSIIINFNDNYENGDLIFWDNYKIDLGIGDIVVFPSLFLFPHRVEEVTKNVRYSGVCWGW